MIPLMQVIQLYRPISESPSKLRHKAKSFGSNSPAIQSIPQAQAASKKNTGYTHTPRNINMDIWKMMGIGKCISSFKYGVVLGFYVKFRRCKSCDSQARFLFTAAYVMKLSKTHQRICPGVPDSILEDAVYQTCTYKTKLHPTKIDQTYVTMSQKAHQDTFTICHCSL